MNRKTWFLVLILACGLVLRVYDLGTESFWLDEGISIRTVTVSLTEMKQILSGSVHPPLYYLLLRPWTTLFGHAEFAARMLSVIFSLISIFMAYRVGRLLFDTPTGLFAALLVAFSLFQIRYAQEARNYSLFCMLSTISYFYLIKLVHSKTWTYRLAYLVVSILMLYTHVFGLFTIISHHIYVLFRKLVLGKDSQPSWTHWIGLQVTLVICFLPWLNVLLHHVRSRQGGGSGSGVWQKTPSLFDLAATFAVHVGSQWLLLICLAMGMVALLWWHKTPEASRRHGPLPAPQEGQPRFTFSHMEPIYLLLVWLGSHTLVPFLLSQVIAPFYKPRYTIAGSIALYVLIAVAMRRLPYRKIFASVALAGLGVFYLLDLGGYYDEYNKERWREATAYIDDHAKPGELLLFNSGFVLQTNFNYYSKRNDLIKMEFPDQHTLIHSTFDEAQKALTSEISKHDRVWIVFSHSNMYGKIITNTLKNAFVLKETKRYYSVSHTRHKPYLGIEILMYERVSLTSLFVD